jgi:hypothetical protein
MSDRAWLAFVMSSDVLFGELSLRCSIILIAACSSARFSNSRPLSAFVSSSSLEFCAESGGEMTACAGSLVSSVMGGGDCRILEELKDVLSAVASEDPGGEGS